MQLETSTSARCSFHPIGEKRRTKADFADALKQAQYVNPTSAIPLPRGITRENPLINSMGISLAAYLYGRRATLPEGGGVISNSPHRDEDAAYWTDEK